MARVWRAVAAASLAVSAAAFFAETNADIEGGSIGSARLGGYPPSALYGCDSATLQCVPVADAQGNTQDLWASKTECEARCAEANDPCKAKGGSCGECLGDSKCGWCSQAAVYGNGRTGSQCASHALLGSSLQCAAQFSAVLCTGNDSPVEKVEVGSSVAAFVAGFKAVVIGATAAAAPANFGILAGGPTVGVLGDSGSSLSSDTVGAFLDRQSLLPLVREKLAFALPALMFAHGGEVGVMAFQRFDLAGDEGELILAFASARCSAPGASDCDVVYAYGDARAQVLQQYETYHEGCCGCSIGGCGTLIRAGCHGCDRQTPRPDTAEELADLRLGLQALTYNAMQAEFPVPTPGQLAPLASRAAEEDNLLAARAARPHPLLADDAWATLRSILRAFMNRADTQELIGRHSGSDAVTKVQLAIKDISSEVNVLKIPQVALSDVVAAIGAGAAGLPINETVPKTMAAWVTERVKEAQGPTKGRVVWSETEAIESDGVTTSYFTVRMFYDPAASAYVDLVICGYQNRMHLERLSITTSTSYGPDGQVDINITSDASPVVGDDLHQFEVLWKYAVDDAVVKALEGLPQNYVTPRMRLMPLRVKAGREAAQRLALGAGDIGSFTSFLEILKLAASTWQSVVSAFSSKTTEKIQIISQGGFTKFNEATDSYTVPGVQTSDTAGLIDAIMSEYDPDTRAQTKQHLMALLFSHSQNDTSTWLRQHIVWGQNTSSGGCGVDHGCAEFFIAHVNPHLSDNSNHWAVCSYKTDFVLAPTIELITTSKSYLGGLFQDDHDEIQQLPALFTPEDETKLREFMGVQCQYMLSQALGVQGLQPPVFPSQQDQQTISV